jgi:thiamine biosynthesis lipoprotein
VLASPGVRAHHGMHARRMLFATHAMATRFEIVIEDDASVDAQCIGEAVIAEIERLHQALSRFAPDSLLSHINRNASHAPERVDAHTFQLFVDARAVHDASGGAFDPSRGTGMEHIELDAEERTIFFKHRDTMLDLGGIAKGHAVQRAADMMRDFGITRGFVHGGTSSIATIGSPIGATDGWAVTLAPRNERIVHLKDCGMSASSNALRVHITDSRISSASEGDDGFRPDATHDAAKPLRIAAIVGPCARRADAWSTALVVLGKRPASLDASWSTFFCD